MACEMQHDSPERRNQGVGGQGHLNWKRQNSQVLGTGFYIQTAKNMPKYQAVTLEVGDHNRHSIIHDNLWLYNQVNENWIKSFHCSYTWVMIAIAAVEYFFPHV